MSASDDEAQEARKRAHWVSLRTLQRVPSVVGETPSGEPIVEVGSARLVLPHGSNNFYHLSRCPECGTETATDVVLTTAHLSHGRPLYCADCARRPRPVPAPADEPAPAAGELVQPAPDAAPEPPPRATTLPPVPPPPTGGEPPPPESPPPPVEEPSTAATRQERQERWERLVDEVSQAVAGRLEGDRAQLVSQLANAVSGALEQHRQALAREVAEGVAGQLDTHLGPVGAAVGGLEPKLRGLEDVVTGRLDESHMEVMAQLETALGTAPENPRQVLASDVGTVVAERMQGEVEGLVARMTEAVEAGGVETLARVQQTLGDGLDEQRRAVATEAAAAVATRIEDAVQTARVAIGEQLEQQYRALATDVGHRFEEQRRRLGTDVGESFAEQRRALAADVADMGQQVNKDLVAMAAAVDDRLRGGLNALTADLEARFVQTVDGLARGVEQSFDDDVRKLGVRLISRFDESQTDILSRLHDLLAAARELAGQPMSDTTAATFFAVRDDLNQRLDRVADEAVRAGMNAARVTLRATEEHVVATSVALAARINQLESELASTRESLEEMRRSVDRMARRIPSDKPSVSRPRAKKAAG